MAERRITRKIPALKRVSYRIAPDVEAAIVQLAADEEASINGTVQRLLTFGLAHVRCRSKPTFGDIHEHS